MPIRLSELGVGLSLRPKSFEDHLVGAARGPLPIHVGAHRPGQERQAEDAARDARARETPKELERKVEFLKRSTTADAVYLRLIIHCNEHMGQLIAYARMNGIAPPWSKAGGSSSLPHVNGQLDLDRFRREAHRVIAGLISQLAG